MNKEYEKYYKITDDGRDEIKYEDSSCSIILIVQAVIQMEEQLRQ